MAVADASTPGRAARRFFSAEQAEILALKAEVARLQSAGGGGSTNVDDTRSSIVVVGGGRMGEIRCRDIMSSPRASLAGFVDHDVTARDTFAGRYGCNSFATLEQALISAPAAKGVWVSIPSHMHKEAILLAASHGKHVAVEKPVTMSEADTARCYEACERAGVHLHCAFQRRTDPAYQAVAAEVAAGNLGAITSIHAIFRDHPCPPMKFLLAGGDVFHDLATHDIDFILSLLGGELPSEVYARGASMEPMLKKAGVMDTATVVLGFPSGLNVSMELSRNASYGYDQRLEVFGSNGNMCAVENSHKVPMVAGNSAGIHRSGLSYSFPDRFREAYESELDLFADIIEGKATPKVTSHDAVMASRIAEAALQSALKGIPIKLDMAKVLEVAAA